MREQTTRGDMPDEDAKSMWQSQPTETNAMTQELIGLRARELRARTRRQLIGTLVGPVTAAGLHLFDTLELPALPHFLHVLFVVALSWSLTGLYFLNRGMWPAVMPRDAGLTTGLAFCRQEIERRRTLLWSFGPVMLAITTFILALAVVGSRDRSIFPNGIPFLAAVVIWVAAYFVVRSQEQRKVGRELAERNRIER